MTIIFSSAQADISSGDGLGGALGELGEAMGIPGLMDPHGKSPRSRSAVFDEVKETAGRLLDSLRGKSSAETYDQHFVGSGRQVIPGGQVQGGKTSPLESASVRRTTSQEPSISVLVKKRAFASLNHYYTPALMDDDELWLFRATKRLFQRKCQEIADYERISKIKKISDNEGGAQAALLQLTTYFGAQVHEASQAQSGSGGDSFSGFFSSAQRMEQTARDREPRDVTTWFSDPDMPILSEMGQGSGVFEITLVTSVNTNLSISGSGNSSVSLENPYNILQVTEYDIEQSIRDTALSNLVEALAGAASLALKSAQVADSALAKARRSRLRSSISFNVSPAGGAPVTAVIDAIGFLVTPDNLDTVPEDHDLDSSEQNLFKRAYKNLGNYSKAVEKQRLKGLTAGGQAASLGLRNTMEYVRRMLRKCYMGKLVIQPMDTVHVFIHGNTRQPGEGLEPTADRKPLSAISNAGSLLGPGDSQALDDSLLHVAWEKSGQYLTFSDFKKLNTIDRGGIHVFAGLVRQSSNRYNADQGRYEVSVNVDANIEWLKLSRYNKEPSLNQTQGIVYDPLTPFQFKTDPANGLPIGELELTDVNKKILGSRALYQQRGRRRGERMRTTKDLQQDVVIAGGTLTPIYEMPPGLKYRWKEGVVTATYTMSTVDPLDKTKVQANQLRRDIGFFTSNTVWDNMDAANIISVLVTGQPYNLATFVQSAANTGAFALDTAMNDPKNYFHSLLPVQQSLNRVQGNFSPFKYINTDRRLMARAFVTQQRLKDKSSRLQQLRGQQATLQDNQFLLEQTHSVGSGLQQAPKSIQYTTGKAALEIKLNALQDQIDDADEEFTDLLKDAKENVSSVIRIAGDDITFSFSDPKSEEEAQLFGDKLVFATQRRREDVMYNRDKSYLIVSEEYDKDYDIQAFALNMRRQGPNMWKSSYEDPYQLCKRAAEMLDFEFFTNTQGHIEFRPPQYNRTPLSVMRAMLALNKTAGIKVFPDFLEKLFSSREESLINDILALEWEIRRQAALLGRGDPDKIAAIVGEDSIAFLHTAGNIGRAISQQRPLSVKEKQSLKKFLSAMDQSEAQSASFGLFSAQQQLATQQVFVDGRRDLGKLGAETAYNKAVKKLVSITGKLKRSYPSFQVAKVGAKKNGQSTPASDVSGIIGQMGSLLSKRSRLLQTLDSVLSQSVEIAKLNEDGTIDLGIGSLTTKMFPGGFYDKLIEDDTQHILGHMASRRFIIDDDVLLGYSVTESPPGTTHWGVAGTDPMVGEKQGNISGGFPLYLAIGVDFDLVRQYGFRSEKTVDKPMFWSAEKQCAPYAKMLLTRERKDLIKVNAQVIGNEFYQLGDVVYLSDLQMLFYVYGISHSFTFESGFSTSLDLRYGHPPGEYIPTPLDIMGKGLSNRGEAQISYRTRRQRPASDTILGVVKFPDGKTDMDSLLSGPHGRRNSDQLQRSVSQALSEVDISDSASETTPHVVVMAFGDNDNKSVQESRMAMVKQWLSSPRVGGATADSLTAGVPIKSTTTKSTLASLTIPTKLIDEDRLAQLLPTEEMNASDKQLLKAGIVASGEAWLLDETLDTVVEIRLRRAPPKGWSSST